MKYLPGIAAFISWMVLAPVREADAAIVTFESASDISDHFNATGTQRFTHSVSGGISGSGGVVSSANTPGALVTKASVQGGPATLSFKASIQVLYTDGAFFDSGRWFTLGLTNSPTLNLSEPGNSYVELSFIKQPMETDSDLAFGATINGVRPPKNAEYDPRSNDWHEFRLEGTWDASVGRYQIRFYVEGPADIFSQTIDVVGGIDATGPIYAFVWASGSATNLGFGAIDNFEFTGITVPEPSACAMMVVATLGALGYRRRVGTCEGVKSTSRTPESSCGAVQSNCGDVQSSCERDFASAGADLLLRA